MNLLGKIFVVGTLIASICLMIMALFVYATHTNWKEKADNLQAQYDTEKSTNEQLTSKYLNQFNTLESEKQAALQDLAKLESERAEMITENSNMQRELDGLRQEQRKTSALVASTERNNERLQEEVATLRTEIRDNQQQRDANFKMAIQATSKLHTTVGELQLAKQRNEQLAEDNGLKTSLLRSHDIDETSDFKPHVRGLVSATLRDTGGLLIEITVGADDGIKKGQTVEVFRGTKYLGRAEIVETAPDRAVARVLRRFQLGTIQKDDHVSTRLRAS